MLRASPTPTIWRCSARAFETFHKTTDRPTLIIVDSHIGYGSPHKHDSNAAHGEPLGEEEVRLTKKFYGWPEDAKFLVPEGVQEHFREGIGKRGREFRAQWSKLFADYSQKYPELAERLGHMQHHELPAGWDKNLPTFPADAKGVATRESSGKVLNVVAQNIPVDDWRIGGSCDIEQDHVEIRRRWRFSAWQLCGAQPALWRTRTRDGREREWDDGVGHPGVWRNVLQLQRLHAREHPAGGADASSFDLHLHARFHWTWARTGRRINRSSNWRRCGPCRT